MSETSSFLPTDLDYTPQTRFIFGPGSVNRIGDLVTELGARKVLLVTDPGVEEAGHPARVQELLHAGGLEIIIFDDVIENPTGREVSRCVEVSRSAGVELIIGLGGGSALDTAKGCNFVLTNGGRIRDYQGHGKTAKPLLPMIAVPTTAGTGSESQSYALISDEKTHQKMACGVENACPVIALLDPELTVTQPRDVAANTGMDALSHAIESAVALKRNPVSAKLSRESFRLLFPDFLTVLNVPEDIQARSAMQRGAALAGLAIENSMLGAAHAMANPLTAHYNLVHGRAVGLTLPAVIRYNAENPEVGEIYRELVNCIREEEAMLTGQEAAGWLADELLMMLKAADMPTCLVDVGVDEQMLDTLAAEAEKQWTGTHNPRLVKKPEFLGLYRELISRS
jgi:alcohol dehydrogenase